MSPPSGDVTTRNQQVAQVISGEDKTLYLTQKVITVRMLGDIAVANGTYTLHHKVNSAQVDEKGVFTHVFERVAAAGSASTRSARCCARTPTAKEEGVHGRRTLPHSVLLKGRQGTAIRPSSPVASMRVS